MGQQADLMKRAVEQIETFFEAQEVTFSALDTSEMKRVEKSWLKQFAQKLKNETGLWIYANFKWHGFSYKYETAIEGSLAMQEYQNQWIAPYFVFGEDGTWSYECKSKNYPDFSVLHADIYVVHHNMKWTMVFTHEQPHEGPYFASKE